LFGSDEFIGWPTTESSLEKAVSNISLLTNKFSFVSWENDRFRKQGLSVNRNMLEPLFNKHQMRMNIYLTKEFERLAYVTRKHHEIMVLEKTYKGDKTKRIKVE
jgi:hypothetical protein